MIRKAIVLAAGLGTRLRPLTLVTPKPLMPVWGEPMLARTVAALRALGVDDIVVNCHYLHEQVEAWCRANGCRCQYEPEIRGTGGVLNPLRDWIGDESFYLVNGDIVVDGFKGFGRSAENLPPGTLGLCLVTEDGPRTIEVEPATSYVTCWQSPDPGWEGTYTFCGLSLLTSKILRYVPTSGFSTLVAAMEKAASDGLFMRAIVPRDLLWTDAGTVTSYVNLNRDGDDNAFGDFPQLKAVMAACGHADARVEFLGARGSERVFFKLGDDALAVIYDDTTRTENGRYAGHTRWLKEKGVAVPSLLADLPEMKVEAFSWAGVERKMSLEDYVKVVEALARFNALGTADDLPELQPAFDRELWEWEHMLFEKYCLGKRFSRGMDEAVRAELGNVASLLEREPVALVHRDFQSTNVLWKGKELTFIDYQGMRLGPAAYDLASLLYDPYVTFTEGERRALAKLYAKACGREEIVKILPYAAVQRLSQCLGAYGRLASVGQPQFSRFVLPALRNLLTAADEAGLDAIGALAEDLIAVESPVHAKDPREACACRHGHAHEHGEGCSCGHCDDD